MMKISILGSTGSIGTQTLEVVDEQRDIEVVAMSCGSNLKLLEKQRVCFKGKWIQIWGDPFLADITQTNRNKRLIKNEELRLLQGADWVFYVSKLTLEQQKQLYPTAAFSPTA